MIGNTLRGTVGLCWLLAALVVASSDQPALAQKDKKGKFEVFKDKAGAFRWRYKAANGAILATPGQGYKARADCVSAITSIQKNVGGDKLKVEYYQDTKKEHRWRLKAANGQVVAVASQGCASKSGAEKGFASFQKGAKDAEVVEEKGEK